MLVEVRVVGGPTQAVDRAVDSGTMSVGELLAQLVSAEVRSYQDRRETQMVLRVLTDEQVVAGQDMGRMVSGGRAVPPPPSLAEAVTRAVEAFHDGLFLVVLDDRQLEDLGELVNVGPTSRLRLVRLVALAGG